MAINAERELIAGAKRYEHLRTAAPESLRAMSTIAGKPTRALRTTTKPNTTTGA